MTLDELIAYINDGREIEFKLENEEFFVAPVYKGEVFTGKYSIYNNISDKYVVIGDIMQIISFEFEGSFSFKNDIEKFEFKFIL